MHPVEGLAALDLLKALAGNPDLIQRPEGGRPFELVSELQPGRRPAGRRSSSWSRACGGRNATRCCWA